MYVSIKYSSNGSIAFNSDSVWKSFFVENNLPQTKSTKT